MNAVNILQFSSLTRVAFNFECTTTIHNTYWWKVSNSKSKHGMLYDQTYPLFFRLIIFSYTMRWWDQESQKLVVVPVANRATFSQLQRMCAHRHLKLWGTAWSTAMIVSEHAVGRHLAFVHCGTTEANILPLTNASVEGPKVGVPSVWNFCPAVARKANVVPGTIRLRDATTGGKIGSIALLSLSGVWSFLGFWKVKFETCVKYTTHNLGIILSFSITIPIPKAQVVLKIKENLITRTRHC